MNDEQDLLKILRSVARAFFLLGIIGIILGFLQFWGALSAFARQLISPLVLFMSSILLIGGINILFLRRGLVKQEEWSYHIGLGLAIVSLVFAILQIVISVLRESFTLGPILFLIMPALIIYYLRRLSPILVTQKEGFAFRYWGAIVGTALIMIGNIVALVYLFAEGL